MKKAGRPRKNGVQPIGVLRRETLALFAYERAREAGEKHCVAVSEAVKYIRQTAPRMRISETEVKRIVAYWRPRGSTRCLRVSEPGPSGHVTSVPVLRNGVVSFIDCRVLYTASHGPRPIYPRANAASKPTKKYAPFA
jgi:hypothetical protein